MTPPPDLPDVSLWVLIPVGIVVWVAGVILIGSIGAALGGGGISADERRERER